MNKNNLKLTTRISSLENGTFIEDDIKLLLIEIRERLKNETFLREICDFVAHSDRSKGICHKKVDVRYAKLKLFEENTQKKFTPEFVENNKTKPWSFFTDTMLDYIQASKIEKFLFELLIISGIDDIDNELFVKHYRLSKREVKKLVTDSYKLNEGFYTPKTTITTKNFILLDDLLKFIRGTITGRPAFTEKEIVNDFIVGIKNFCKEIDYKVDYDKINNNSSDLIICIISILHESTFKLFDGTIGNGFLSLHPKDIDTVICLMSKTGKYTLPLITTDISARQYIDYDLEIIKQFEYKSLPWNNCIRDKNGKLKLIKYEA